VRRLGLDRTLVGKLIGRLHASAAEDGDAAAFLSLLYVEVTPPRSPGAKARVLIRPALMDDVQDLFRTLPADTPVDVTDPNPPVDRAGLVRCLERFPSMEL
jgi:hypothetical protein